MATREDVLLGYGQLALGWGLLPVPIKMSLKRPYLPKWQLTTREDAWRRYEREVKKHVADGIGILTGQSSGVVVVDIDDIPAWTEFIGDREIPATFIVRTAGGGLHYYFRYGPEVADLINSNRIYGQKFDYRTDGGVIVFAGNITTDGRSYVVAYPPNINEVPRPPFAEMPTWLHEYIRAYQRSIKR